MIKTMQNTLQKNRLGFTIIELLVVIMIIGMLLSMLLPAIHSVVATTRHTQCKVRLNQIGTALENHHAAHRKYPIGNVRGESWTFQAFLLPYMGNNILIDRNMFRVRDCFEVQINAMNRIKRGKSDPEDRGIAATPLTEFACPESNNPVQRWESDSWGTYAIGSYFGVMGSTAFAKDGMLFSGKRKKGVSAAHIRDGASKTLFVGERGNVGGNLYGWWACGWGRAGTGDGDNLISSDFGLSMGGDEKENRYHFWSEHTAGVNFLFADGHVDTLDYDIDYKLFRSLSTRNGKESIPNDF